MQSSTRSLVFVKICGVLVVMLSLLLVVKFVFFTGDDNARDGGIVEFPGAPVTARPLQSKDELLQERPLQQANLGKSRSGDQAPTAVGSLVRDILPSGLVFIYDALSQIKIDDNGDVIVDQQMKETLESSFNGLDLDFSADELEQLQDYIRLGLSGDAGDQAAKIFKDYYLYRVAEADFLAATYAVDVDDIQNNFDQLKAIREAHLGYEVAQGLYEEEYRENQRLFDLMRIQSDPDLSEEEKLRRETALNSLDNEAKAPEALDKPFDEKAWDTRAKKFDAEKQAILDLGLSQEEEASKLQHLYKRYYGEGHADATPGGDV